MDDQISAKPSTKNPVPPYMSWKTLIGFIGSLSQGIPDPIDTSSMLSLNGNNRSWTMGALRYLRLVTSDNHPESVLRSLVVAISKKDQAEYKTILSGLLKESYTFLFQPGYDLTTATPATFTQRFTNAGLSGETVRKGENFFIEAAKEAGITISPYVLQARKRGPRAISGSTASKSRKKGNVNKVVKNSRTQDVMLNTLASRFPDFDPNWSPEAQEAWFEMYSRLLNLAEGKDENKAENENA
jgi:hypothetical protein